MEEISERFRIGAWSIDPAVDEVSRGAEVVKLEPRMMRLLCRLAASHGNVVSNQQLLDDVWPGVVVGPASVYQAIFALRKILGDTGNQPTYIATVARKGYRMVAPVKLPAKLEHPAIVQPTPTPAAGRTKRWKVAVLSLAGVAALAALAMVIFRGTTPTNEPAIPASTSAAVAWPSPDLPTIVVLPFQAATPGESDDLFAAILTDVLENRLIAQLELLAVSTFSAGKLADPGANVREVGTKLHAEYVLRGSASRTTDQLRAEVTLFDTASGNAIWSKSYVRTPQEITALREEIVSQIGDRMNVRIGKGGGGLINLEAHELYVRGFREYRKGNKAGIIASRELFHRATTLYPDYARAFFGLAVALKQFTYYPGGWDDASSKSLNEQVLRALDRALELDPDLGEAMIDRANSTEDPVEAEKMFRLGMALAPGYFVGPYQYCWFLVRHNRVGEGLAALDHGLRIDPLSPLLMETKSFILLVNRGDIAGHNAMLRELLANHPEDYRAEYSLGVSRQAYLGETAEGIKIIERGITHDPGSASMREAAATAYLEANDPDAAEAVAHEFPRAKLEIAQYRQATHPLAALPVEQWQHWFRAFPISINPVGEAMRDEAMATGDYAGMLAAFQRLQPEFPDASLTPSALMDLAYAHTLMLSGDSERGREVVKSVLQLLDTEQVGRPEHWFARIRATAYALLGDDERALAELTEAVKHKNLVRWWYTAELDPVFARLRKDPRFQALALTAKQHRAQQRALLDEMRRKGEVPKRAPAKS